MKRLDVLVKNLPEQVDGALITGDVNRRYYTGVKSSAGVVVVTREQRYLIIDSRYFEVASAQAVDCVVVLQKSIYSQIDELLTKHGAKTVALESETLTVAQLRLYEEKLNSYTLLSDGTLSDAINGQRAVKSEEEKNYIQISQDITDKTFAYILTRLKTGMTEREIALDMEFFSLQNGSEEAAFDFIVACGANSSKPHAVPGEREIQQGDFVLFDFGSTYNGYRSDMTRVVAVGEPTGKQKDVYGKVLEAQQRAMALIKEGVVFSSVHKAAEDFINLSPYAGKFDHGLGHSLGLEIHEPPNFNKITQSLTKAGNVMSVEPGIYLPGEFGVRIEDIIFITKEGFSNFTNSPKELIII